MANLLPSPELSARTFLPLLDLGRRLWVAVEMGTSAPGMPSRIKKALLAQFMPKSHFGTF
jgi:hypothetical protein